MEGTVRLELSTGVATMERLSFPSVGEVDGVVRDAEGKPVAGAQLLLRAANPVRPGPGRRVARNPIKDMRALADRHGRYRIRGMPTGDWVMVQQQDVPARAAASSVFTVEAGQKISVDVEAVR